MIDSIKKFTSKVLGNVEEVKDNVEELGTIEKLNLSKDEYEEVIVGDRKVAMKKFTVKELMEIKNRSYVVTSEGKTIVNLYHIANEVCKKLYGRKRLEDFVDIPKEMEIEYDDFKLKITNLTVKDMCDFVTRFMSRESTNVLGEDASYFDEVKALEEVLRFSDKKFEDIPDIETASALLTEFEDRIDCRAIFDLYSTFRYNLEQAYTRPKRDRANV